MDPALAAEPLVTIPLVWEGEPDALEGPHASAVARLQNEGSVPRKARAATRTLSVVDRLLVLARVVRQDGGQTELLPPLSIPLDSIFPA